MKGNLNRGIGWVTVFIVIADWVSKFFILNAMEIQQQVAIVDGWFYLLRMQNSGIAFGVMNNGPNVWRTSVLVFAASGVLWVLAHMARSVTDTPTRVAIALIAGGALGNLGDRLANGGVTDFLAFSPFPYVFNIADSAIVVGAILLALRLASTPRPEPQATNL